MWFSRAAEDESINCHDELFTLKVFKPFLSLVLLNKGIGLLAEDAHFTSRRIVETRTVFADIEQGESSVYRKGPISGQTSPESLGRQASPR